jgi:hypothetical protein
MMTGGLGELVVHCWHPYKKEGQSGTDTIAPAESMFLLVEVTALLVFRHDLYFFPSSCHCQYLHCCVFGRCQLSCSWQVRLNNIRDKMIGGTVTATPVELFEIRILASPRLFPASGPGKAVPSHRLWFP